MRSTGVGTSRYTGCATSVGITDPLTKGRQSWVASRGSVLVGRYSWVGTRGSVLVDQYSWISTRGSVLVDRYSCKEPAAEAKQGVPEPAHMLAAITGSPLLPLLPWHRRGPSPLLPSVSVARQSGCRVPCFQPSPMRTSQPRICYFFSRLAERVLAGLAGSLSNCRDSNLSRS